MNYVSYITEQIVRDQQSERRQDALLKSQLSQVRQARVTVRPTEADNSQGRGMVRQEIGPVTR